MGFFSHFGCSAHNSPSCWDSLQCTKQEEGSRVGPPKAEVLCSGSPANEAGRWEGPRSSSQSPARETTLNAPIAAAHTPVPLTSHCFFICKAWQLIPSPGPASHRSAGTYRLSVSSHMLFFFAECFRCICVCFRSQTRAMYSSADTRAYPEVFHVLFSLASWVYPEGKKYPVLEIPCGQQDHRFVLYNPAAGFPFSGNSVFWKSSAKAARLIYVTSRNQTLIATFHKQRTAPRTLVWR